MALIDTLTCVGYDMSVAVEIIPEQFLVLSYAMIPCVRCSPHLMFIKFGDLN